MTESQPRLKQIYGEYGFFIGYWKKYEQPELEDLKEQGDIEKLEKKLKEAKEEMEDDKKVS